jgi:hypothetical protein
LKNNSPTEAGQTKPNAQAETNAALVDAINQSFALLKLNYHNQFMKAYSKASELNSIKRLWLETLGPYGPQTILEATKSVVISSEFLPTMRTLLKHCDRVSGAGFPDVRAAYVEACCASSPKADYVWSHPVIYHCGRKVGWQLLHCSPEDIALPAFRHAYDDMCEKVRHGLELAMPNANRIEKHAPVQASEDTRKRFMDSLNNLFLEDEIEQEGNNEGL